jgi:peptidoglycan hydrolase-like protein with peptidoglycan-binding domain
MYKEMTSVLGSSAVLVLLLFVVVIPVSVAAQEPASVTIESVYDEGDSNLSILSKQEVLSRGDKGESVLALQHLLAEAGVYLGPLNGRFGPKTQRAVKQFQIENKLRPDGVVGTHTREAIAKYLGLLQTETEVMQLSLDENSLQSEFFSVDTLVQEGFSCAATSATQKGSCVYDADNEENMECIAELSPAITISGTDTQKVLEVDFVKANASGLILDLQFEEDLSGWMLNIGNSSGNNGWGGDSSSRGKNSSQYDSEFQIYNGLASIFRNDIGLYEARKDHLVKSTEIELEELERGSMHARVSNGVFQATFMNAAGESIGDFSVEEEYIFAIANQDEELVDEGYDARIFIGINRTIGDSSRSGGGVSRLEVSFIDASGEAIGENTSEEFRCEDSTTGEVVFFPIDQADDIQASFNQEGALLENLTNDMVLQCSLVMKDDIFELSEVCSDSVLLTETSVGAAVVQIPNTSSEETVVALQMNPEIVASGWIFNLGDSSSNNGWGGDQELANYDGEIHLYNGLLTTYNDEISVSQGGSHLAGTTAINPEELIGNTLQLLISTSALQAQIVDESGKVLYDIAFPEGYVLGDGEKDGLYLGINRTIADVLREGVGVVAVHIYAPATQ